MPASPTPAPTPIDGRARQIYLKAPPREAPPPPPKQAAAGDIELF